MENVFDQDIPSEEVINNIVEEITEQQIVEDVSAEDFTVADESDIDWSIL